jgi:hypothetical protein
VPAVADLGFVVHQILAIRWRVTGFGLSRLSLSLAPQVQPGDAPGGEAKETV